MTAFSYTDWTSKSADEQKSNPGISVERDHVVNNPDRGTYWSGTTAASALTQHVQSTLTGDDRVAAAKMWNGLKQLHRGATESPRMVDRAMATRQSDAHVALGAYNGDLDHGQLEQLTSVFDDVVRIQKEAQLLGVDPVIASRRLLDRAASRAMGYELDDARIVQDMGSSTNVSRTRETIERDGVETTVPGISVSTSQERTGFDMRPLVQSREGSQAVANLNHSVAQLQTLLEKRPLEDALDMSNREDMSNEERSISHRRLSDILTSVPLVLNPQGVEPEKNFSVRMETQEEATVMETMVRWAGDKERLPTFKEIHRAFASWRDNGLNESPYSPEREPALGIVVGQGPAAQRNAADLIAGLDAGKSGNEAPVIVLAVNPDKGMRDALAASGRPVVDVTAEADARGVHLSSRGQDLSARRIELVALTPDQAADPIERSLAVNAVVGRSEAIGYVAGTRMNAVEAQAIHLAGTLRKLNIGMEESGSSMSFDKLRQLRGAARDMDAQEDPQRYYTAGHARPHKGVSAVAFESASRFDLANRANAPGRDLMAEAYASIPKGSTVLSVDNPKNALNGWLKENATNRTTLYAEATRDLSFAQIAGAGLDGERRVARTAETKLRIYDRPEAARQWETITQDKFYEEQRAARDTAYANKREYSAPATRRADKDMVQVMRTPEIDWNDAKVRGALIMVKGNANDNAINTEAQGIKVAQEKVMDVASSAVILTDQSAKRQSQDIHASTMLRLATEMRVPTTVIDGTGREMALDEARGKTREVARNHTQKKEFELGEKTRVTTDVGQYGRNAPIDVKASDDLGQLALAGLPGMDAARAIRFAHTDVTLAEIRTDKSDDMRKHLLQFGMPAETRAIVNDVKPWEKAVDRALANMSAARDMGAQLHLPTDVTHPVELASGDPVKQSVFTVGEYDFAKQPVAAFIGSSQRFRDPGITAPLMIDKAVMDKDGNQVRDEEGNVRTNRVRDPNQRDHLDPADVVDRAALRKSIEEMTAKGYGIGVTLEQGVSRAVMEEARNVPDARLVVVAPGNMLAASPEMRRTLKDLLQEDRAAVIMPTSIAPTAAPEPRNGEERAPDRYASNLDDMQYILAKTAKVGIVVATSDRDQAMHVVKHMVAQDKPVAAMVPQDVAMAGSELYSGNMRLMRGAGRTHIESLSLAQATSANAYAAIDDKSDGVVWENGVRRGDAGTFKSEQLSKAPMARSGRHYSEMGWGAAAHAVSTPESLSRFVDKAERGEGALGQYRAPTERELEKAKLEREFRQQQLNDGRVSRFAAEEFGQTSALHRSAISKEAGYQTEVHNMDEKSASRHQAERDFARHSAASGHSMV